MSTPRHPQLANAITLSRILGVGLIFWLTPFETNLWLFWTVSIYTIVCLTDFLDGWLARKLQIVTDLGKVLDPLADKILVLVFLPLLQMGAISAFPVFLILAREFIVMGIRVFSAKNGTIIPAGFSGKLKTALTLPICGLLFMRVSVVQVPQLPLYFVPLEYLRLWIISWPSFVFSSLIWLMVGITIWSLYTYAQAVVWNQLLTQSNQDAAKAKRKLKVLIPNGISFLNLLCGIGAATYAWFGLFHPAVLLVLIGTILDALDGRLARKLDAYSAFGAKLDSKADFVNFGIAPAVVIFSKFSTMFEGGMQLIALFLGIAYYASVHYRLRRFDKGGHSHFFEGLPSPVGAGLVVLAAISTHLSQTPFFIGIIMLICYLMVSRIPYPHMDILGKQKFLRLLLIPLILFLALTILHLLNIPFAQTIFAYEALFGLVCIYLILPVFSKK